MTAQEIRDQLVRDGLPENVAVERYEDSEQFVGQVLGEQTVALTPIALALAKACGLDEQECCDGCCGCACESNCPCG